MSQHIPLIGSKINLISKLGIRYEGILYTVDVSEGTVALAKVRSFGTENRTSAHVIPGQDEVYEYVIFKVSDVKEVIVCDVPKPAYNLEFGLPHDPAIVAVSEIHAPSKLRSFPVSGLFATKTPNRRLFEEPTNLTYPPVTPRIQQNFPGTRKLPTIDLTKNLGGFNQMFMSQNVNNQLHRGQLHCGPFNGSGDNTAQGVRRGEGIRRYYRSGGLNLPSIDQEKTGMINKPIKTIKFHSDYDFEKANDEFKEYMEQENSEVTDGDKLMKTTDSLEQEKENTAVSKNEVANDEALYDKKKSFFDRISCQSLDKPENRQPRFAPCNMRGTNHETFGYLMPYVGRKGKTGFTKQGENADDWEQKSGIFDRNNVDPTGDH